MRKPLKPLSTEVIKCPIIAINEPLLLEAIQDYNSLLYVPLINNLNYEAPAIASTFVNAVMSLTDEQCDNLKNDTIDLFNYLVTKSELADDFIPSEKIFPITVMSEALEVPASTNVPIAADIPAVIPSVAQPKQSPAKPTTPPTSSTKPNTAKQSQSKPKQSPAKPTTPPTSSTKPNTAKQSQSKPKVSFADKLAKPTATMIIRACIIEGIVDAEGIKLQLSHYGLESSNSTISLMINDVKATLDYIEHITNGGVSLCKR